MDFLTFILFLFIFIILYYIINELNKISVLIGNKIDDDSFANTTSSSDINTLIIQAVNNKYKADVEAIRNLSSIAHELQTNNNVTVPGNIKSTGAIRSDKDLSVGGKSTFDADVQINGALILPNNTKIISDSDNPEADDYNEAHWIRFYGINNSYRSLVVQDIWCNGQGSINGGGGIICNWIKIGNWTIYQNQSGDLRFRCKNKNSSNTYNDYGLGANNLKYQLCTALYGNPSRTDAITCNS